MKIEARRNHIRLTLETTELAGHSAVTDHQEVVRATIERAASWFDAEVERLLQGDTSDPLAAFQAEEPSRTMPIIVNGKAIEVDKAGLYLSFREVVALAGLLGEPSVVFVYPDGRRATLRPGFYATLVPGAMFLVIHSGAA